MAIDFSLLPKEAPLSLTPPSRIVWSLVFVVLAVTGAGLVLRSWPRAEGAQTVWFWFCVGVLPICLSGALVLRRFSAFHGERNRRIVENRVARRYIDAVFEAASVPLAVLAMQYRLSADDDENTFDALVARAGKPPTCVAKQSGEVIAASWLQPTAAILTFDDEERQRAVLEWLLRAVVPAACKALSAVPARIPVTVCLDIHTVLSHDAVLSAWEGMQAEISDARLHREPLMEPVNGVWLIDTMLDEQISAPQDIVTLLISANLETRFSADPASGSAEAACMLLLCPARLAHREKLSAAGWIHRPQGEVNGTPGSAVHYALKWGGIQAETLGGTMRTGIAPDAATGLRIALHKERAHTNGNAPVDYDADLLVGNTSQAAPWLAAVLALERAHAAGAPFLVGAGGSAGPVYFAVHPSENAVSQDKSDEKVPN